MNIVARSKWGARPPRGRSHLTMPTRGLWLHHLATDSWHGPAGVRACQNFHMDTRKWADIAYSFLVDTDGTVYGGRGAGVVGAHTQGHNSTSHAICAMGNFDRTDPPTPMLNAIARLVAYGHDSGWWPPELTGGHRDAGETACPGSKLYRRIGDINRSATGAAQEDEDMSEVVEGIQRALTSAGGDPGPVDGVWGPRTEGALATALQHAAVSEERDRFFEAMHRDLKAKGARPSSLGHMLTWYRELREQHPTVPPPGPS